MTTNNWHVPIHKFSDEQRAIIERVYGVVWSTGFLVHNEGYTFTSPYSRNINLITHDEAFKILGLDRLLETDDYKVRQLNREADHLNSEIIRLQKENEKLEQLANQQQCLQGVDWDSAPKSCNYVIQGKGSIFFSDKDCLDGFTVLATRPKPKVKPLTDEQIEAVREFHRSLQFDNGIRGVTAKKLDAWLKEREQ